MDKQFTYKGLSIDRNTWESAPIPICTKAISDENMQLLVEELFDILNRYYRFNESDIKDNTDNEDLDMTRWREEEELIIKYGGVYYEDLD
jgi:hypothetical protein